MRLGETPVLIPNTMVKTRAADGTTLETMWESRWSPGSGDVAQLGEHLPCKQGVKGSNPFISTLIMKMMMRSICESHHYPTSIYLFLENRIPNNIKIFCDESKDSKEDRDIRGCTRKCALTNQK